MKLCSKIIIYSMTLAILLWSGGCFRRDKPSQPTSLPTSSISQEGKIKWFVSIDEARKEAINSKKLMMIHFYTTWSDWSKKMDKETYTYYKVIDLSKNFVCVRVDLDKNQNLEDAYQISGNPTIVFEDPVKKKKIKKIEGIMDRHEMTKEMTGLLSYKVTTQGGE